MIPTIDDALRQEIERSSQQKHFSQGSEQEFILGAVPKTGRFLDIGAWNAVAKSNTRALYELGWAGVMIEPSPGPMRNLIADYGNDPRIQLVSAAVAVDGDRIARMHISDDALSTTEEKRFDKWKVDAHFDGMLIVPVISVSQILEYFGQFEFVSIDTEGTSVEIFKEFLRLGHRPACVCVEYDDRKGEALAYAARHLYDVIHENENNLIFQRQDI